MQTEKRPGQVMNRGRVGSVLIRVMPIAVLVVSCAGPQPLDRAIHPADMEAYVNHLNVANMNAREAFFRLRSARSGEPVESLRTGDASLSTTENPFDAYEDPDAVSMGAVIYRVHCARCHGDDARGLGPSTLDDYPANDFKSIGSRMAATLHRGAPRRWFRVINEGSGDRVPYPDETTTAMPPFGRKLTREQIWLVITYLQSLDAHLDG